MYWWHRLNNAKSTTIKNATMPTILVAILFGFIVFSEFKIMKLANNTTRIAVFSLQSEDETTEKQEKLSTLVDQSILENIDKIKLILENSEFSRDLINSFFASENITGLQQQITLAQFAKIVYAEKNFYLCEQILLMIDLEKRIPLGVQFTLALSQSQQTKISAALESYKLLIEKQPYNQSAAINYALILSKNKQFPAAEKQFKHAIEISSGRRKAKSYAGLGDVSVELHKFKLAVEAFRKSIEYRPQHANTWKKLARSLNLTKAQPATISSTFEKALSLGNKDYRLHNEYGRFLLSRLDFKKATIHLLKAKKLAKNHSDTRLHLAISYLERNKNKDARKQLNWIIRRKKSSKISLLAEALMNFSKKKYAVAKQQLANLDNEKYDLSLINYYLARIHYMTKQYSPAINGFNKLASEQHWGYLSILRLSRSFLAQKKFKQSLLLVNKLLEETLNRESLLYQKTEILGLLDNNAEALIAIEQAHEISPKSSRITVRYAKMLHLNNRSSEAISQLEDLLLARPQYSRARESLAKINLDNGNFDAAISHYTTAISNDRENTTLKYQLAEMLVSNKNYNRANSILSELLLQQSNHLNARILLARSRLLNQQFQQSLNQINLALKLDPENITAINLKDTIMSKL